MKQIIAIFKPIVIEAVIGALSEIEIVDLVVAEAKGYGKQKNYLTQYVESDYSLAFVPKVEMTVWVDDDQVDAVIHAITDASRTGRIGDGKIFVVSLCESVAEF